MSKYMLFDNGRNEDSYVEDKVKLLLALLILLHLERAASTHSHNCPSRLRIFIDSVDLREIFIQSIIYQNKYHRKKIPINPRPIRTSHLPR